MQQIPGAFHTGTGLPPDCQTLLFMATLLGFKNLTDPKTQKEFATPSGSLAFPGARAFKSLVLLPQISKRQYEFKIAA